MIPNLHTTLEMETTHKFLLCVCVHVCGNGNEKPSLSG